MPKPGADLIVTQKHRRAFRQPGGPLPTAALRYSGADESYLSIDDDDNPITGGRSPIRVHAVHRRGGGAYDQIGETTSPPDLPTASITLMHKHNGVPWADFDGGCFHNFYEVVGACTRPDDPNGWSDYVKIYSWARGNSKGDQNNTTQEDDNASTTQFPVTLTAIYKVGKLLFGQKAGVEVEREVVDVVFGSTLDCGTCGPADDGTRRIYAVTKSSGAASPGTPAEVIYSVDGGLTWSQQNITGLGGTVDPTGIAIVGNVLVVLDTAGNGYWTAALNPLTGVPSNWQQVTSGFIAAKQPTDIYVVGPNEIWFSANGGYLYRSTDIAAGVSVVESGGTVTANLQRIHGQDDTIVATGDSGTILKSGNRGATWATTTTSPTSATVRAILVLDDYRLWIGTSGGKVYYSINGGETWAEQSLPGTARAVIDDIVAATDEVIHIAARSATPTGLLLTTWNGGATWNSSSVVNPRLANVPTTTRLNRLAVPRDVNQATAANTLLAGGLSGGGTDGVLLIGAANRT